jgi:Ca2+-binding RTX toxin-like protein
MSTVLFATPQGGSLFGAIAGDIDEIFIAGIGSDRISGDQGDDSFVFQTPNGPNGGYGGNDYITDFEAFGGSGDTLKLRNLSNGVRIEVSDLRNGSMITILPRNSPAAPIQTITLPNVTAFQLLTQGQLEINGQLVNEASQGIVQSDRTNFSYTIAGAAGNTVVGGNGNNLVTGDTISPLEVNTLTDSLAAIGAIVVPGAGRSDASSVNLDATGSIPESLLPRAVLNKLEPANAPATANDDLIMGGAGNDLLIGGPGNDTVMGGAGTDVIVVGAGQDVIDGGAGVDYYAFDSLPDASGSPATINYVRLEPPYGAPLTDPLTARTGPDVILINSKAFNLGIDPLTFPDVASRIGVLKSGTILAGDAIAPNDPKNGQLKIGESSVIDYDGPQADDIQPLFYYSTTSGILTYDRDGAATEFAGVAIANLGSGIGLPAGTPSEVPNILIYVY